MGRFARPSLTVTCTAFEAHSALRNWRGPDHDDPIPMSQDEAMDEQCLAQGKAGTA